MTLRHHIKQAIGSPDYLKILTLRTLGNFLVLSSLFFIGKTFYLPVREEIRYYLDKSIDKQYVVGPEVTEIPPITISPPAGPKGLLAKALNLQTKELLIPIDTDFGIVIPKIAANARILSNVDASDEQIYLDALNKGVAQAAGTAFPGDNGHIFLFAHSTDYFWNVGTYNAIFYLLQKLEKGDEVNLFYKGQRYLYRVTGKTIVNPSQVEYLTRKTNKEFLTLQTCWPPGTTLKRLLVFASPIGR